MRGEARDSRRSAGDFRRLALEIAARFAGRRHHFAAGLALAFEAQRAAAVAESDMVRDEIVDALMAFDGDRAV